MSAARAEAVAARLADPPRHPRPAFTRLDPHARVARLTACLESQGATVVSVDDLSALPAAVEELIRSVDPQLNLYVGDDPRLCALPWPAPAALTRWTPDRILGDGTAALTHAWGAAAETGTLIMTSSAASPASLSFLPELHLVALARADIAASFEDAFSRLCTEMAPRRFPRAVNLISSPSRTSDIGGRSVRGAHGPRSLAVVVYGSSS